MRTTSRVALQSRGELRGALPALARRGRFVRVATVMWVGGGAGTPGPAPASGREGASVGGDDAGGHVEGAAGAGGVVHAEDARTLRVREGGERRASRGRVPRAAGR